VTVTRATYPVIQNTLLSAIKDKALPGLTSLQSRTITLEITVSGTSYSDVQDKLDVMKAVLNNRGTCSLIISTLPDRYWNARWESLQGQFTGPLVWQGYITFVVPEPLAYSTTEDEEEFLICDWGL
jgi:predicted phage tail component-like protein